MLTEQPGKEGRSEVTGVTAGLFFDGFQWHFFWDSVM